MLHIAPGSEAHWILAPTQVLTWAVNEEVVPEMLASGEYNFYPKYMNLVQVTIIDGKGGLTSTSECGTRWKAV